MSDLFTFRDEKPLPDGIFDYPLELQESKVPLVIDNGIGQTLGFKNVLFIL